MGLSTSKTEKGKCPQCGTSVEYEGAFDYEASAHECSCPECDWRGWESYDIVFYEMTTKN